MFRSYFSSYFPRWLFLVHEHFDAGPIVGYAAGDGFGDAFLVVLHYVVFGVLRQGLGDEQVGLRELAVVVEPQGFFVIGLGAEFAFD